MGFRDTLFSLIIAFLVIDTITVGLRVDVRTRITKSFKYDDVGMLVAYAGLVIYCGLVLAATHYGYAANDVQPWYNSVKADQFDFGLQITCFLTSGVVKVAVALVLYRVSTKRTTRIVLIADMAICATWVIATSIISAVGCMNLSPWTFASDICYCTDVSRQVCYIVFDFFHAFLPIAILWNVQISRWMKLSVVSLFLVGLIAAAATVVKLTYIVRVRYHVGPVADFSDVWAEIEIWTVTEHGASIFACSVLALRPLLQNAAKRLSSFSTGSKDSDTKASRSTCNDSLSPELLSQNKRMANSSPVHPVSTPGGDDINASHSRPDYFYNMTGKIDEQFYRITHVPVPLMTGLVCIILRALLTTDLIFPVRHTVGKKTFRKVDTTRLVIDAVSRHMGEDVFDFAGLRPASDSEISWWAKKYYATYAKLLDILDDEEEKVALRLCRAVCPQAAANN